MAECSSMMSATQEACQDELEMADAMCSSSGFSGSAAASSEVSDGLPGRQLQEADWQEIVYKVSMHSVQKQLIDLVLKTPCCHTALQILGCGVTWGQPYCVPRLPMTGGVFNV